MALAFLALTRGSHESFLATILPAAGHHRSLAGTHCAYPQKDGQADLTRVAGCIPYRDKCHAPGIEPGYGHPSRY